MNHDPAGHHASGDAGEHRRRWPIFRSLRGWRMDWLAGDLAAGLTLAAIAVPEQMATARLAGLPVASGFYAFIGGSVAIALIGANPWMSVGADSTIAPIIAAGLAGIAAAAGAVVPHVATRAVAGGTSGAAAMIDLAGTLALMVGAFLILARVLRLGWLADLLSIPVTTGFLAGIAVRIVASQLPGLLGVPTPGGGPIAQIEGLVHAAPHASLASVAVGAMVLLLVLVLARVDHRIPGALIAVVGASLAVTLLHLDRLGVALVGPVSAGLPGLALPHVTPRQVLVLAQLAAVIAVVCIMQTSAVARSFPAGVGDAVGDDVAAVGAGSILAALLGGFAVDASPPRTALVEDAGGRSQVASLVAVVVIALLLRFAAGLVAFVPNAALGGILVYVAMHIFRLREIRRVFREARVEFLLLAATAVAVVVMPIANAITFGIVLSLAYGVSRVSRPAAGPFVRQPGTTVWWSPTPGHEREEEPGILVFGFEGPLIFTSAHYFRRELDAAVARTFARAMPAAAPRLVVLEASGMVDLDYTGALALRDEIAELRGRGITTAIARLESAHAAHAAERLGVVDAIGREHVFFSVAQAVDALAPTRGPA